MPKLGLGLGTSAAASSQLAGDEPGTVRGKDANAAQAPPQTARVPPLLGLGGLGGGAGSGDAMRTARGPPLEQTTRGGSDAGPSQHAPAGAQGAGAAAADAAAARSQQPGAAAASGANHDVPRLPLTRAPSEPPLTSASSGAHGPPPTRKLTPPKPLGAQPWAPSLLTLVPISAAADKVPPYLRTSPYWRCRKPPELTHSFFPYRAQPSHSGARRVAPSRQRMRAPPRGLRWWCLPQPSRFARPPSCAPPPRAHEYLHGHTCAVSLLAATRLRFSSLPPRPGDRRISVGKPALSRGPPEAHRGVCWRGAR